MGGLLLGHALDSPQGIMISSEEVINLALPQMLSLHILTMKELP